jgi:hypothetical protein
MAGGISKLILIEPDVTTGGDADRLVFESRGRQ